MENEKLLERIVSNPKIMGGKPTIRGTRLTVQYILKLLADGEKVEDILAEYNGLSNADISACLLYASNTVENLSFLPLYEENSA